MTFPMHVSWSIHNEIHNYMRAYLVGTWQEQLAETPVNYYYYYYHYYEDLP